MGKLSLLEKLKNWFSDFTFAIFLRVNGYTKEGYYRTWIGYSEEEHNSNPEFNL